MIRFVHQIMQVMDVVYYLNNNKFVFVAYEIFSNEFTNLACGLLFVKKGN